MEVIVNMCIFFLTHARFIFKIKTNYSEKQPKVKYMQYTHKKSGRGEAGGVGDAEMNRQGADNL